MPAGRAHGTDGVAAERNAVHRVVSREGVLPEITGIAHVELTVRDLDASEAWYCRVLGMRRVWEGDDAERGIRARALLEPASRVVLGLTEHSATGDDPFDVRRAGLDHLSFAVADRAALKQWERHLDTLGVTYTPLEEWSHGAAITLRDPDGIALELYVLGAAVAESLSTKPN